MADQYVETGYVERGYVEGSDFNLPEGGVVRLRHFVSGGSNSQEEAMKKAQDEISEENEVALVYFPEERSFAFATKEFYEFFFSAPDPSAIASMVIDSEQIINSLVERILEKIPVNFTASIVSKDGGIVSGASVQQIGERSFEITVPDSLVATGYKLIISEV